MQRAARVVAPALAGLLLSAIPAVAQEGATLRVAGDGSADFSTINAAIEAAAPGDAILIAPGEYVENLHLDKPLTLRGDGPREDIVILHDESDRQIHEMDPDGPSVITILVDDADVTIERLAIMDEDDQITSILLDGGQSVIRDVFANDFVGVRGDADVVIEDSYIERLGTWGPNHTVATGNEIHDFFFASEGSSGRFEGNTVFDLPVVVESGADFQIVGNTIKPSEDEPGIVITEPETRATVTGNDVEGGWVGILVEFADESLIEGNDFHHGDAGVVAVETRSTIRGNTITDVADTGVEVFGHGVTIEDNTISGGRVGIHVEDPDDFPSDVPVIDEPPRIVGNTIAGASHFGLVVEDSAPVISGNTICAGREAIRIEGDADPRLGSNEICETGG